MLTLATVIPTWSDLYSSLINGIVAGAIFALAGAGLGLIFGVTQRFHFAYATAITLSVYVASSFISDGITLYAALMLGVLCSGLLGVLTERVFYRPLAGRGPQAALLGVFVTSLGLVIIGENAIALKWGSFPVTLQTGFNVNPIRLGGGVVITTLDVVTMATCAVLLVAAWLFLRMTTYGRAVRAVQENPDLATAVGINGNQVYLVVFFLGSVFAGVVGILLTWHSAMEPNGGEQMTFTALVVIFLAGLRSSPLRFALAGVAIGWVQSFSTIWVSPTWQYPLTFLVLLVFVALTPYFDGLRGTARGLTTRVTQSRVKPSIG
jgi:branched-subunit amino acid ABC-type transport system permease component